MVLKARSAQPRAKGGGLRGRGTLLAGNPHHLDNFVNNPQHQSMTDSWTCYHCNDGKHNNLRSSVWATLRVMGYLDEHDVTLCMDCAHELLSIAMNRGRNVAVPKAH